MFYVQNRYLGLKPDVSRWRLLYFEISLVHSKGRVKKKTIVTAKNDFMGCLTGYLRLKKVTETRSQPV